MCTCVQPSRGKHAARVCSPRTTGGVALTPARCQQGAESLCSPVEPHEVQSASEDDSGAEEPRCAHESRARSLRPWNS